MPAVPFCAALLQTVRSFRHGKTVRMHSADSRKNREERREERLQILRDANDRGEGYLARELREKHACAGDRLTPHGRAKSVRRPFQEVTLAKGLAEYQG